MARVDLNIVDRGINGSKWVAEETALTADRLDKVIEQKTDNSSALNSLPTPFARFFVAREAFRRVHEEHINPKNEAGFAYRQMVSDILDVFELLFYSKYHKNNTWKNGEKIELREWKSQEELAYIKEKMPVLYNSIHDYYITDIKEDKLYFLIYSENGKDKLLACSSPITGFVTPPDMDKAKIKENNSIKVKCAGEQYNNLQIRRKSSGFYFRDIILFGDRDVDFKNYMYNTLFGGDNVDSRFKEIKEYIHGFRNDNDIRNDYGQKMSSILTDQNDPLIINRLELMRLDEVDVMSFFTDTIIKLPYRISDKYFFGIKYQNDTPDRDYDYLMPFKAEVFNLFNGNVPDASIHLNRNDITVSLRYNGKEYKKFYDKGDTYAASHGKIVDLSDNSLNFDLGLFPNILSHNDDENNYFKVLVVAADENPEAPYFNIDEINLTFYRREGQIIKLVSEVTPDNNAQFGTLPSVIRSRQSTETGEKSETKFYEVFNTAFDVIEVEVFGQKGLIVPQWEHSNPTDQTFTYAVDLGTSNTFMSRCKNNADDTPDLSKNPELFSMERPMVSYLHEVKTDSQFSINQQIENSIFEKARKNIKTEFLPAMIDGTDYKFPIRTAICSIKNKKQRPKLFDNHNIAFFYEKLMPNDDQEVHTNIKWEKNEEELRIFVRELLLIIKCDILQRNGDLNRTRLVWFSPLSFSGNEREMYNGIWTSEPKDILFINPSQVSQYSESEAPYYYYNKKRYIADSDAVTVIDIGGGSTDFVYFKDNKAVMANSVHFGCDVLWENGYIEFESERSNGIYNRYADTITFDGNQNLKDLNDSMIGYDGSKTKDIINFWLSNDRYCNISKKLSKDFKPVFVYHFTSILYYMAQMYKDNHMDAPRTIVFSGNGSKYIDNFITGQQSVLKAIINLVFSEVFGGEHNINLTLPEERKEATCYGGLYRDRNAENVKNIVYQGTADKYESVGDLNNHFQDLKSALVLKYKQLAELYKKVLDLIKRERIMDNTANISIYVEEAAKDMSTPLSTYYKTQVKQKYGDEVIFYDSVFFIPIVDRIFEMTKL